MSARTDTGAVVALARKDLQLLLRNRGALFFAIAWPVLVAVFFGSVFGGLGPRGQIPIALVDEDGTPASGKLVERLRTTKGIELSVAPLEEAERLVRQGKRAVAVIVPRGYGEASGRLFHGAPARLTLAIDPSRTAEAAMAEGILTGAAMQGVQEALTDPVTSRAMVDRSLADLETAPPGADRDAATRFLGELRTFVGRPSVTSGSAPGASPAWQQVAIERRALAATGEKPRNAFDVTFPQGILWGVIGSALGFALSLVTERTRGTLSRLQTAPIARGHVLAGKALACFVTILAVEGLLFALGRLAFGVRPSSWGLLIAAGFSVAVCFVGIMMVVAVLGQTEQSAGGLGWAVMLPLTMVGGGMVPLFAMPAWMQVVGTVSPVHWGILALEGAIWRGFGPAELALPCGVLMAIGVLGLVAGARLFARE